MKPRLLTQKTFLSILLLMVFLLSACQAQVAPQPVPTWADGTSIPSARTAMIAKSTDISPAADAPAYLQALQQAVAQNCATLQRDQICYGNGQLATVLADGSAQEDLSSIGSVADLASVTGLTTGGSGATANDWGLALLKMQADFSTPDLNLMVAVLGDVDVTRVSSVMPETTVPAAQEHGAIVPVEKADSGLPFEPLQEINFSSRNPGDGPDGLLIWTPPGEDLATIRSQTERKLRWVLWP